MKRRSGRGQASLRKIYLLAIALFVLVVLMAIFLMKRYAPTTERMSLDEYFVQTEEDQTSVILNGTYMDEVDGSTVHAIHNSDGTYIELSYLKNYMDDGYVYDSTEEIMRYVTDEDVISVNFGSSVYTVNKEAADAGAPILISEYDSIYVFMDFVDDYTDITYYTVTDPDRLVIETAGWEHKTATVKRPTEARRFGGVKSKILGNVEKGDEVTIIDDYGKWSLVLTDDGILGCIRNSRMKNREDVTTASNLPERTYHHISLDNGSITMAWHQVTNATANANVTSVVEATSGLDVISPTWFQLSDNNGSIKSLCSSDYVSYCHNLGLQVWGLVSNLENKSVDTTTVLNTTSARDNLVNNLVSQAIAYNLDGINVDMESLSIAAKDGYIEFIRELSLKCEKNDLVLSVDNYAPSESTIFYNRSEQAKFADYIVIMAYDEHFAGDDEAGSVASLDFVENAVETTMQEVPAEQIIMGLPLYCRVWFESADGGVTSKALSIDNAAAYVEEKGISLAWDETEGQYIGQTTDGDRTVKIWLEDAKSLACKMGVMQENALAGVAAWKLGFDNAEVWTTIANYMN